MQAVRAVRLLLVELVELGGSSTRDARVHDLSTGRVWRHDGAVLQIIGVALLVVAVLGGLAVGPWLIAALLARRRDQPDLVTVFTRRASTSALVLGALAALYPVVRLVVGEPSTAAAWGLLAAGLLLIAAGVALRRVTPSAG